MNSINQSEPNKEGKYKVVTKKGVVVASFRLMMTAKAELQRLEEEMMEDLEIVKN